MASTRPEGFRKYLHNTSWMFADRVVRLGAVFITAIYMARVLGDQLFGQLNYVSGFVGLFVTLTAMGLDEIVVRDLVRHPEKRDELLGSAAMMKFIGSVILALFVLIGTQVNGMDGFTTMLAMVIAAGEALKPLSVVEYHFQARVEGRLIALVNIVQTIASTGFKLLLCVIVANPGLRDTMAGMGLGFVRSVAESPLSWFAWSYVVDTGAAAIGYRVAYQRSGLRQKDWKATRAMMGHLLHQSWPLIIYGMALLVHARIDQVMIFDVLKERIGEAAAYAEVGQYSVALKMIEAMGFVPVILQKSLAPAITRARMEDPAKYHDRLLNQYRLMFLLFLVISVPLYFIAEPMITLLYGEPYRQAGALLALFAIRLLFTNMGVAKSSWITNEGMFKYSLLTAVVGAAVNIALNYFLIPPFKAHGAIWATIGSFLVSIFLLDLVTKETRMNLRAMCTAIVTFWKLDRVR
jgi:O-antigen/teichoic acid export membrane protein